MNQEGLLLDLADNEWPLTTIDHDRLIARAIVVDNEDNFYFVRANRDDDFGKATLIETAGGGVEAGEDLVTAIKRELAEELGVDVEVMCKIGVVSDYYNLIHRHNINNYFLCKVISFGDKHLTKDEIEDFHLSTLKLEFVEEREMRIIDLTEDKVDYIEDKLYEYDEAYISYKLNGRIQIGIEDDDKVVAGLDACMTAFKILYVSTVFVDEAYRRKGYGKMLIDEMEKRAKALGANTIRLDTFNWQGKDFYEALGYQIVGSYDNNDDGYSEFFFLKRI